MIQISLDSCKTSRATSNVYKILLVSYFMFEIIIHEYISAMPIPGFQIFKAPYLFIKLLNVITVCTRHY